MRLSSVTAALVFAVALPVASAEAMPLAQPIPLVGNDVPAVTLASGGCGIAFHRGPFGGCRPNVYGGYGYRRFGFHRFGYRRFGYRY